MQQQWHVCWRGCVGVCHAFDVVSSFGAFVRCVRPRERVLLSSYLGCLCASLHPHVGAGFPFPAWNTITSTRVG